MFSYYYFGCGTPLAICYMIYEITVFSKAMVSYNQVAHIRHSAWWRGEKQYRNCPINCGTLHQRKPAKWWGIGAVSQARSATFVYLFWNIK